MKIKKIFLAIIIINILNSCGKSNQNEEKQNENDHTNKILLSSIKDNPNVKIGKLISKEINEVVHSTGSIEVPPSHLLSVHSKTEGYIKKINYVVGNKVKEGDVLVTLESPVLINMQMTFLESKADLKKYEKEYERAISLRENNAISDKDFELILANKDRTKATYLGLLNQLKLIGVNMDDLINNLNLQSFIPIKTSISGIVSTMNINLGMQVNPNDEIMTILSNEHVHLELNVLSKDMGKLKPGLDILFTILDKETEYLANVWLITPNVDPVSGTVPVHCHIKNEENQSFIKGIFVTARILTEPENVYGVPLTAVVKEEDNYYGFKRNGEYLEKFKIEKVKIIDNFVVLEKDTVNEYLVEGGYYVN